MEFQTTKPATAASVDRLQSVSVSKLDSAESRPHERRTQAPRRDLIGADRRPATCPQCGHVGAVPRTAPGSARIRCTACGTSALIRQCVGPRPTRFHHRSAGKRARSAAALDAIDRYVGHGELNDRVDDLFLCAPAAAPGVRFDLLAEPPDG